MPQPASSISLAPEVYKVLFGQPDGFNTIKNLTCFDCWNSLLVILWPLCLTSMSSSRYRSNIVRWMICSGKANCHWIVQFLFGPKPSPCPDTGQTECVQFSVALWEDLKTGHRCCEWKGGLSVASAFWCWLFADPLCMWELTLHLLATKNSRTSNKRWPTNVVALPKKEYHPQEKFPHVRNFPSYSMSWALDSKKNPQLTRSLFSRQSSSAPCPKKGSSLRRCSILIGWALQKSERRCKK